jgi:hypothetical protein
MLSANMLTADLVVLAPDLPQTRLAVEVKSGAFDRKDAIQQLKVYMDRRDCPVALLITPERTWLLRNTYDGTGPDSIEEVGEYPTSALLGLDDVPDDERELVQTAESWLERLTSGSAANVRSEARGDVSRYVLPAVTEGRVASGSLG